jgi:amino-acid N-acetyltransferase
MTIRPARPARLADLPALHRLIDGFASQGLMLGRTTTELCGRIREFLVADQDGTIHGCVAMHIYTESIAEVRSLAVAPERQGTGLGRCLVEGCLAEAAHWGLRRLICLTYQVAFFARLGFVRVDRSRFPDKVWSDCIRCPGFLDCREVAMWRLVEPSGGVA